MYDKTDTKITQRDKPLAKRRISTAPFFFLIIAFIVMAIVAVMVVARKADRTKREGVMEARYAAGSPVLEKFEPTQSIAKPLPPKFKHVIFRLGDEEVFRFIYEEGGEENLSFELREGDS